MTTVASRIVRSSPYRDTSATWEVIVELLTRGKNNDTRAELMAIAGIASSIVAERAPKDAAIVATCDGPRTRIYCLYDEDALDGSDANEEPLGYEPLKGDWKLSLPCAEDDLAWVQRALKTKTTRVTARDMSEKLGASTDDQEEKSPKELNLDVGAFLKS